MMLILQNIEEMGASLAQQLALLEQTIVYIFSQIKHCDNKQSAQGYFECLDKIQLELSRLVCKENIGISQRLHRFMKDFDNFEEAKEYYFEKIKNGSYVF